MSTGGEEELPRYLKISKILEPRTARQRRRDRERQRRHLHQLRTVQERIFHSTVERGLERAFTGLTVCDSPEVDQGIWNSSPQPCVAVPFVARPLSDPFLPTWATSLESQQRMDGGKRSEDCALELEQDQKEQKRHISSSCERHQTGTKEKMEIQIQREKWVSQ
ncbi:Rev protein [Simian immunodeficiency virus]|uniref:Rev protein n=1 Tax=Simian immunodeficiency virus TaxID=11723 RepID=Q9Q090_SIV|nr:Rev protein [Simian immunodeficiency virus]